MTNDTEQTKAQKQKEEDERLLGEPIFDTDTPPMTKSERTKAVRKQSERWGAQHREATHAALKTLLEDSAGATADERSLLRVAAASTCIIAKLDASLAQLAARLELLVDNPQLMLAVAKSMREITRLHASSAQTAIDVLQASGTLRAQRRLMDQRERTHWYEHNGGGCNHRTNPGSNSPSRPAQAN